MTDRTQQTRTSRMRKIAAALLVTTILAGSGVATGTWTASPAGAQTAPVVTTPSLMLAAPQAGFADLAEKVKSAVVNIATEEGMARQGKGRPDARQMPNFPPGSPMAEMFKRFMDQQKDENVTKKSAGSGFIVDPSGYIVTNNHVIDGATKITVTLDDGTSFPATVKGRDPKIDVALLKIDAKRPLIAVEFANSDAVRVGDWMMAVGNPFGLGGSVTAGIVSAHNRNLNAGPYDDFLQIDAPINPGNSGGPLFNQQGQVIGIATAIYSPNGGSVGIGFAVPSNLASKVVAQLRETGTVERGWLGVQMQPLTPTLAKAMGRPATDGVLINKVEENSPAAAAGLRQGDVVLAFDGRPIKSPRDLAIAVADTRAGSTSKVAVWREGRERAVNVTIAKPAADKVAANDSDEQATGRNPVGLALAPLSAEQREELSIPTATRGVVVAKVTPGSRADESGFKAGDVIVRVGDDQVTSPADAVAKIRKAEDDKKEALPLLVMREGTTYYLALQLAAG